MNPLEHDASCTRDSSADYTIDCDMGCAACRTLMVMREASGCPTPGHMAYCGSIYKTVRYDNKPFAALVTEAEGEGRTAHTVCSGKCGREHRVLAVGEAEQIAAALGDVLGNYGRNVAVGHEVIETLDGPTRRVHTGSSLTLLPCGEGIVHTAILAVERAAFKGHRDAFAVLDAVAWGVSQERAKAKRAAEGISF